MIAFAIAALALIALTRGAASGLQSAAVAAHYQQAISRARSHIAVLDTAMQTGDTEGDDGGGYRWRLRIVPIATIAPSPDAQPQSSMRPTLYRATVTIAWTSGGGTRTVELTTERLGTALPDSP